MGKIKEFLILNAIMPLADCKFHTGVSRWYRKIDDMMTWSPEKIKSWQEQMLQKRIQHAYCHIPYYHDLFNKLGLKPDDIKGIEDLKKIPPLTKDVLRNQFYSLVADDLNKYHHKIGHTGGSTGTPMKYISDNNTWGFINAFGIHLWKQTGYHYGDKFVGLGSSSIGNHNKQDLVHRLFYRMKGKVKMSSDSMHEDELKKYTDFIIKNKIHYIYGFASSMFLLAKYVKKNDLASKMHIKAVYPTSDILTDNYAQLMKDVWHCDIIDSYGAYDGGINAYRCVGNGGYKVGYNCIVEIERMNGDIGDAILTDVVGLASPIIRYKLGDILELDDKLSYSNFWNGQVLKKVLGRNSEITELRNGYYISSVNLNDVFEYLHIKGYKVSVVSDNTINVEIVPMADFTLEEERQMIEALKVRTGNDYTINVIKANKIVSKSNGKSLYIMTNGIE